MRKRSDGKASKSLKLRPGVHAAFLYGDPAALGEVLSYAAAGTVNSETCAFLAYGRFNQRIAAQLRDLHGIDVRRAQADNTLAFLEGRESARELKADLVRFFQHAKAGRRQVRLITSLGWGEPGWPDEDELLRLEAGMNELCREFGVATLCLYDARQLHGGLVLDGALSCHPVIICRGESLKNPLFVDPATLQHELATRRRGEGRLRAWLT